MKKHIAAIIASILVLALVGCTVASTESKTEGSIQSEAQTTENTDEDSSKESESLSSSGDGSSTTETNSEKTKIRIGGLKGPTSIGMVKLLNDNESGLTKNEYEFTLAGSADELTPKLINGELDILAVPANLGAVLYNKTEGKVQMLAVNTLGVLYICEKGSDTIKSIEDLKGQTIYMTGKGATPEYTLAYLLKEHGLDIENDVTIEWQSEHTETVAAISSKEHAVALLPQPFVTVAQTQLEDLDVALDLTKEWDALDNGSQLITGILLIRKDFAENNKQAVENFLEEYNASTDWVNENVDDAAALVEKLDIIKEAVAKKAIPYCNITCISGDDMKEAASGYLKVLYDMNPQAVGGKLPLDDFYYGAN